MTKNKKGVKWVQLIAWIGGVELVGITGGLLTIEAIPNWYAYLNKPWFSPPNWLFGPVWTLLYAMIGYVGYRLWENKNEENKVEKVLFLLQLGLNAVWTPIFFGLRNPAGAMVVIACLWFSLVWLIKNLWQKKNNLSLWLIPYLAWVSFASMLNLAIVWLN